MAAMNTFSAAISFAQSHEIPWPRYPAADPTHWGVHHDDPPPFNVLRGPVHPRGGVSGVIRVRGEEVATWGEPDRADQTFSVAKTYLALLAGIAHARGLLEPGEKVSKRLPGIGFDSPHNRAITWEHLLTQTSEWQGECFGMPDQVEHYRRVSHDPKPPQGRKGELRPLREPGTYWEYNDVRINQLSLALLHLFRGPLPEVFLESVLRPLGGGRDFRWEGYDDAWVEIDGQRMPSVPGGTHWGGGVTINARDQARIGQLLLDGGAHEGRQLVPREWVLRMHEPCAVAPFYGRLTWLNRDARLFAHASRASTFMLGAGGHLVWIDPENQAVVVARWLDGAHTAEFVRLVTQALAR
jgi:CubicO group peptidase (beta-lactamase class C family)